MTKLDFITFTKCLFALSFHNYIEFETKLDVTTTNIIKRTNTKIVLNWLGWDAPGSCSSAKQERCFESLSSKPLQLTLSLKKLI